MEERVANPPNRFRELREKADDRLEQVAIDFGLTKEAVAKWDKQIPSWHLPKLASRYGVSIDHLLRHDKDEEAA